MQPHVVPIRFVDHDTSPSPGRSGPCALLAALAAASLVLTTGCTSMPFMPTSGAGGAFTLATANHVDSRNEAFRSDLLRQVDGRIETMVRAAREQDRARIEAIAERVDARAAEVSLLVERLDRNEQALEQIATMLADRLDRLAQETTALRELATALQDELRATPSETLDRLRRAIETDLRDGS